MQGLKNIFVFVFAWVFFILITGFFGIFAIPLYWYYVHVRSGARVVLAEEKMKTLLMSGETIIAHGFQKRVYALLTRRDLLAITNSRVVVVNRPVFGGFSMKDFQWKDLSDAELSENIFPSICGSMLAFSAGGLKGTVVFDGLPSDIATAIYSYSQAQEQNWKEKNRIRSLEELKAASGATTITVGEVARPQEVMDSIIESLQKVKLLFDNGTISDAEYQELKSKILSGSVF